MEEEQLQQNEVQEQQQQDSSEPPVISTAAAADQIAASEPAPEDLDTVSIEQAKQVFDKFDKDSSGYIDMAEIVEIAKELKVTLELAEVKKIFKELDLNKDNKISFEEFWEWWNRGRPTELERLVLLKLASLRMLKFAQNKFTEYGVSLEKSDVDQPKDKKKNTFSGSLRFGNRIGKLAVEFKLLSNTFEAANVSKQLQDKAPKIDENKKEGEEADGIPAEKKKNKEEMSEKEKRKAIKAKKNTEFIGLVVHVKCEDAAKQAEELKELSTEFKEMLKALIGQQQLGQQFLEKLQILVKVKKNNEGILWIIKMNLSELQELFFKGKGNPLDQKAKQWLEHGADVSKINLNLAVGFKHSLKNALKRPTKKLVSWLFEGFNMSFSAITNNSMLKSARQSLAKFIEMKFTEIQQARDKDQENKKGEEEKQNGQGLDGKEDQQKTKESPLEKIERERDIKFIRTAVLWLLNGVRCDLEFRDIDSVSALFENLGLTQEVDGQASIQEFIDEMKASGFFSKIGAFMNSPNSPGNQILKILQFFGKNCQANGSVSFIVKNIVFQLGFKAEGLAELFNQVISAGQKEA